MRNRQKRRIRGGGGSKLFLIFAWLRYCQGNAKFTNGRQTYQQTGHIPWEGSEGAVCSLYLPYYGRSGCTYTEFDQNERPVKTITERFYLEHRLDFLWYGPLKYQWLCTLVINKILQLCLLYFRDSKVGIYSPPLPPSNLFQTLRHCPVPM